MIQKCARPGPWQRARPLIESNAGANDRVIVDAPQGSARPLPHELSELADRIAAAIVARIQGGGTR